MPSTQNAKKQLPTKWLVAIVGVAILYGLTQPMLNGRLGLQLPTLASLFGQGSETDGSSSTSSVQEPSAANADASDATSDNIVFPKSGKGESGTTEPAVSAGEDNLLHGLLREARPNSEDYLSPGGLRYTRGSEEGHRLKHLERHLEDQPTRPGKHGVFYGDMPQVLRWLDDAYERGERGAKGTSKRNEDSRTVYEVPFTKPVGYIGGRDGKRDGNPDATRIRLVVEGNTLITAFPF